MPEPPERDQPAQVNGDHQRIVTGSDLDGAARHQCFCMAAGKDEFGAALGRDKREDDLRRRHAACRSETQLAVKPGPSAVRKESGGTPFARARSRMNSTVGADMLP